MTSKFQSSLSRPIARNVKHSKSAICLFGFAIAYFAAPPLLRTNTDPADQPAPAYFTLAAPAHAAGNQDYPMRDFQAYPGGGEGEPTAEGEGNGIGGTGLKPGPTEGNGIGGTGQQANENGIGGTGIIGAITGFGSIFVNGYEIEIADNMPVAIKGQQSTADRLAIGQIVEIEADGSGTHLQASSVRVRHELGGTIERIDPKHKTVIILGQNIRLSDKAETSTATGGLTFDKLRVGDRFDVSGFRRADGTIEATRFDPLAASEPDHLIGMVKKTGATSVTVGGLALTSDQSAGKPLDYASLEDGSEVRIVGYWRARRFHAHRIRSRARWRFSNRVRRLAIEGYAHRGRGGAYLLGRYRLARPALAALRQRMIFSGRLDARRRFIQNDVRPARLLKRRGRRIRAWHRNRLKGTPPRLHRKWQNRPHGNRKRIWRKKQRRHRLRHRRH